MVIQTFKPEKYRGCKIYIRSFLHHFEYLVVIKGELYTSHITIYPSPINRLLFWAGLKKDRYDKNTLKVILGQVKRLAETTIDFILDKKDNKVSKKKGGK